MENYSKWAVWKLEDELEKLSNEREKIKALAKHITEIRDAKLARGESQVRPMQAVVTAVQEKKAGLLERIGLRKRRGPDQAIKVGG